VDVSGRPRGGAGRGAVVPGAWHCRLLVSPGGRVRTVSTQQWAPTLDRAWCPGRAPTCPWTGDRRPGPVAWPNVGRPYLRRRSPRAAHSV